MKRDELFKETLDNLFKNDFEKEPYPILVPLEYYNMKSKEEWANEYKNRYPLIQIVFVEKLSTRKFWILNEKGELEKEK